MELNLWICFLGGDGANSNDSTVEGLVFVAYFYFMVHTYLTEPLRNKFSDPDADDQQVQDAELD
jgi:hypothetical protein